MRLSGFHYEQQNSSKKQICNLDKIPFLTWLILLLIYCQITNKICCILAHQILGKLKNAPIKFAISARTIFDV